MDGDKSLIFWAEVDIGNGELAGLAGRAIGVDDVGGVVAADL